MENSNEEVVKRTIILNPVLSSPWTSSFPNSQLGYSSKFKATRKRSDFCSPRCYKRKIDITNECVQHFQKSFPFLTKSQIRGAVVLADNDLILSEMLLSFKSNRNIDGMKNQENRKSRRKSNKSNDLQTVPEDEPATTDEQDEDATVEKIGVAITRNKAGYTVKPLGDAN